MSIVFHRLESPFDFTPELPFREPTVGKQFAVQKNPWWKQKPTADSQGFPRGRTQIECRDGKPIFNRKPVEGLFGLGAKSTVFLGKQPDVHSATMTFLSDQHGYQR